MILGLAADTMDYRPSFTVGFLDVGLGLGVGSSQQSVVRNWHLMTFEPFEEVVVVTVVNTEVQAHVDTTRTPK